MFLAFILQFAVQLSQKVPDLRLRFRLECFGGSVRGRLFGVESAHVQPKMQRQRGHLTGCRRPESSEIRRARWHLCATHRKQIGPKV